MALDPISTMVAKMRAKQAQGLGQGPQLPTVASQQVLRPVPKVAPQPAPAPAQPVQAPPVSLPAELPLAQFTQPAPVPAPTIPALAPQSPLEAFAGGFPTQTQAPLFSEAPAASTQGIPYDASVGPIEGMSIPPAVIMLAERIQQRDPSIRFGRAVDEAAAILGLG